MLPEHAEDIGAGQYATGDDDAGPQPVPLGKAASSSMNLALKPPLGGRPISDSPLSREGEVTTGSFLAIPQDRGSGHGP